MKLAKLLSRRQIYTGRIVDLSLDSVELPNGHQCNLEVIRHPGAAAIVALDNDSNVLLVRQYRYATGEYLLEIPAGKLDAGEAPETCARREIEEETGYAPEELLPLTTLWTTPGYTNERIWLFLARGLRPTQQHLGADEVLTVLRRPFVEAVNDALSGAITDAKSIAGLLCAARHLEVL
jgi:ADP-ribose pyrophosphatase